MCLAFDYLFWKWPILNNLVPVFPPKGVTSNADESNYDRDGNTYKDLVSLLSARSKKFQDMINSKEFALHEEKKTEQLNAYEENGDDDELDRPAEKEKGKEEKEEKASKEKVRVMTSVCENFEFWATKIVAEKLTRNIKNTFFICCVWLE